MAQRALLTLPPSDTHSGHQVILQTQVCLQTVRFALARPKHWQKFTLSFSFFYFSHKLLLPIGLFQVYLIYVSQNLALRVLNQILGFNNSTSLTGLNISSCLYFTTLLVTQTTQRVTSPPASVRSGPEEKKKTRQLLLRSKHVKKVI